MDYYVETTEKMMSERKKEGYLKLAQVVQWGLKYPVKFVDRFLGIELLDYQKYVFMNSWVTPFCVWCQCRDSGKALSLDTLIPTPIGYRTMGDLNVGDLVFDENGNPTKINFVSKIFKNHDCYELTFDDGEKIIADAEHLWEVKVRWSNITKIFTTEQMSNNFNQKYYKNSENNYVNNFTYKVPINKAVKYKEIELPLDPYVLGVWLGDGHSRDTRITCSKIDSENMIKNLKESGYSIKTYVKKKDIITIGIGITSRGQENIVKTKLKELNLINNKHIPEVYLHSSINQRMELLKGLMDTDGSVSKQGNCEFYQKDYQFIKQVSQLLSSLGIKNFIREKNVKLNGKIFKNYTISFTIESERSCFKLKRKHDRLKDKCDSRNKFKTIVDIKKINSVDTKCIGVENINSLYLCGNNFTVTHNSTLGAPFVMTKSLLIPNFQAYLLASDGSQSKELFQKIEKVTKKEIASFTGLTDVFHNELVKSASNTDGFTHNPNSFEYKVYNGSKVNTLNSIPDNLRSKRSNCNFYDEAGYIPDELFVATEPFTAQNSNFSLGGDVDVMTRPKQFPNQLIYASSASSIDTYFYKKYRDFSKRMFLGDKRYFVADIKDEVVMKATYNGKLYPVALLTQEVIDNAIRENPEKANREYKNIFSKEGGDNQIIKRASIIRNSKNYIPILYNDGNKKFIIAYDPARQYDNAIVSIGELYIDDVVGYKLRIVNIVSFADISKKKHTPIRTPEQIEHVKQILLDYNGKNSADYENIEGLYIDSGAGGGGVLIADYFMEDWKDSQGSPHKGLIDKVESEEYIHKFPNAINKLKLMSPHKYKKSMFEALIEIINLDLMDFPEAYDGRDYIYLRNKENDEDKKYDLSFDEKLSLIQIDLAKEELVNIYRYEGTNGNCRYDLASEKANKMHDDRAYCLAMLAWYLQQLRRKHITGRKQDDSLDISKLFSFRQPQIRKR